MYLARLVHLAVSEVPGVARSGSAPATSALNAPYTQGMAVKIADDQVTADCYIIAAPETNLLELGVTIQATAAAVIQDLVGLGVREVTFTFKMWRQRVASLRHRARITALQSLFELDATDHQIDDVIAQRAEFDELPPDSERFLRQIVSGAWEHQAYLDRIIEEAAPSWPVKQMAGVDKAILRIALYEILIEDTEKTQSKPLLMKRRA